MVQGQAESDSPQPQEAPVSLGSLLRAARLHKGLSLEAVEAETRIRQRFLEAMEEDRFDRLPGLVYARGFVKLYARAVGLDPAQAAELFDQQVGWTPKARPARERPAPGRERPAPGRERPAVARERPSPARERGAAGRGASSGPSSWWAMPDPILRALEPARRIRHAGVLALVVVAVAVVGAWLLSRPSRPPREPVAVALPQVAAGQQTTGQEPTGHEPTGQEPTGQRSTGLEPTGEAPMAGGAISGDRTSSPAAAEGGAAAAPGAPALPAAPAPPTAPTGSSVPPLPTFSANSTTPAAPSASGPAGEVGLRPEAAATGGGAAGGGAGPGGATPAPVVLVARVHDRSWMEVWADGRRIFSRTALAGEVLTWRAEQVLTVRFGRPEVVELELNGQPLGVAGTGVITRTFTAPAASGPLPAGAPQAPPRPHALSPGPVAP